MGADAVASQRVAGGPSRRRRSSASSLTDLEASSSSNYGARSPTSQQQYLQQQQQQLGAMTQGPAEQQTTSSQQQQQQQNAPPPVLSAMAALEAARSGRLALLDTRGVRAFSELHVSGAACLLTLPLNLRRLASGKRSLHNAVLRGTGDQRLWAQPNGLALSGRVGVALYGEAGGTTTPALRAAVASLHASGVAARVVDGGFAALQPLMKEGEAERGGTEAWCLHRVQPPSSPAADASGKAGSDLAMASYDGSGAVVCCARHLAGTGDGLLAGNVRGPSATQTTLAQVVPGLYVGCQHDAQDAELLKQHNIRFVVNATIEGHPPAAYDGFRPSLLHVNIGDTVAADIGAYFERVTAFIAEGLAQGASVLVHCSAGVSRSPTLAVAFLMLHQGLRLHEASKCILAARPCACPNLAFAAALDALDRRLFPKHARGAASRTESTGGLSDVEMGTSSTNSPVTPFPADGLAQAAQLHSGAPTVRDSLLESSRRLAVVASDASVHPRSTHLSLASVSGGGESVNCEGSREIVRPRSASLGGMDSWGSTSRSRDASGMCHMSIASPLASPCFGGSSSRSPQEV